MITWSHDHMITWSHDHKITRSHDHKSTNLSHHCLLSFQYAADPTVSLYHGNITAHGWLTSYSHEHQILSQEIMHELQQMNEVRQLLILAYYHILHLLQYRIINVFLCCFFIRSRVAKLLRMSMVATLVEIPWWRHNLLYLVTSSTMSTNHDTCWTLSGKLTSLCVCVIYVFV